MHNHIFIVFGHEHYNPLGIIRSLGEKGINVHAIIIKNRVKLTSKSKYIKKLYFVDDIEEGYKLLIDRYSNEKLKPFIYTASDGCASYLDKHYEDLIDRFYFYNAGGNGQISKYMNKDTINKLALEHGISVLKTHVVDRGVIPESLEYPVITKSIASTVGGWKKDVFICNNDSELMQAYSKIKSPTVLLQKYIEKKNELCLDGFSVNKGNDVHISIASNYNYLLPESYSSVFTSRQFKDSELFKKINEMFKSVGFEGIFSVEFLIDKNDVLYFLEINFRNSTWSYASTHAGVNLPYLWAECMLNNGINSDKIPMIQKPFVAMVEPSDFKSRVIGKRISIFKWISELKETDCLMVYNKQDKSPWFSFYTSKIFGI